ncbi:uncharacterized protein LOC127836629 [Dreissena polymorpha]|uniref:Uncharacterized protein n=1 Tax=Dreissena polymorpha TaxID=45954 RepID=A0A9D4MYT7_DREPO|nr:uncharacterized protein LOC127836629 [Dreissena polymorpha]KAH3884229.1 hypothetical protein DPMN_008204 [Dreissena polymorpha]
MVRYDKCVEALYDLRTIEDRTKTLQILKVMKGAISMSKSRTGECIFRTNKTVKQDLDRLVKIEGRNSRYNISQIDTNKKFVVRRWSRILQNQMSCSSQTLFEEILEIKDPGHTDSPQSVRIEDGKLKSLIDLRLTKLAELSDAGGIQARARQIVGGHVSTQQKPEADDTKAKEPEFVTEKKEIRTKYSMEDLSDTSTQSRHNAVLSKSLPASTHPKPVVNISGIRREHTIAHAQTEERLPVLDRDLTDWGNWQLKDTSWITGYIQRERTKHEDLIIRNALKNIENEMSGANTIKRHQVRQKLKVDQHVREAELRHQLRQSSESGSDNTTPLGLSKTPRDQMSTIANTAHMTSQDPPCKKTVGFAMPEAEVLNSEQTQVAWSANANDLSAYRHRKSTHMLMQSKRQSMPRLPAIKEGARSTK